MRKVELQYDSSCVGLYATCIKRFAEVVLGESKGNKIVTQGNLMVEQRNTER